MSDDPCIFCNIVAGRAAAHVVYEDDLSEEENAALFRACQVVAKRLREVYQPACGRVPTHRS